MDFQKKIKAYIYIYIYILKHAYTTTHMIADPLTKLIIT
jgi:hypothetical protein